jgi:hypothetical protein
MRNGEMNVCTDGSGRIPEMTDVTTTAFSAESWRNRVCCKGDVMEQDEGRTRNKEEARG